MNNISIFPLTLPVMPNKMMSVQKVKRLKLKLNQNNNFILLGLVSAEADYKLSLTLNKKFRFSLKNITPIKITDDTGYELPFSRFSDISSSPDVIINLISNRSGNHFLIKKLKNIDFILQVQNSDNENNIIHLTTNLKELESVTAVFNIDLNTLKDKNLQYLTE